MYMYMHILMYMYMTAAIEGSSERISRVVSVSNELRREQRRIKVALVGVANDADSLLEDCQSSGADCRVLPNPSIFITVANYSMVNRRTSNYTCACADNKYK